MKYLTLVQGRTAIIVCEILLGTARHKQFQAVNHFLTGIYLMTRVSLWSKET